MRELFQRTIANQYEAVFCTLHECVTRCPDQMWQGPVVNHPFSQTVFHGLFFADLYLGQNVESQPRQAFHRQYAAIFADYEQLQPRIPRGTYDQSFVLKYLAHCRDKAIRVVSGETADDLASAAGFPWLNTSRAELHLYNIRHLQHHAAQLIMKLRAEAGEDMPWVKSGWQEF